MCKAGRAATRLPGVSTAEEPDQLDEHGLLRAMLAQLAKSVAIPQSTLDALAQARAKAVFTALTTGAKALPVARVHLGTALQADDKAKEKGVTLTLGLSAGQGAASAPAAAAAPTAAASAAANAAQGK